VKRLLGTLILLTAFSVMAAACGNDAQTLTVYSGRSEELVQPLIDQFEAESGINVAVRYADSAELAATILQEDTNSPADVFFAQDPASLGTVALAGLFAKLPVSATSRVPAQFADEDGQWVGTSGRARTVVYDTTKVDAAALPDTEDGFVDPQWKGRVAIAPTNGSFLAFVAAKILLDGEAATLEWLEGMKANSAPTYPKNSVIVAAVDAHRAIRLGSARRIAALYMGRERDRASILVASPNPLPDTLEHQPGMVPDIGQVREIAGVGQLVHHDDPRLGGT